MEFKKLITSPGCCLLIRRLAVAGRPALKSVVPLLRLKGIRLAKSGASGLEFQHDLDFTACVSSQILFVGWSHHRPTKEPGRDKRFSRFLHRMKKQLGKGRKSFSNVTPSSRVSRDEKVSPHSSVKPTIYTDRICIALATKIFGAVTCCAV